MCKSYNCYGGHQSVHRVGNFLLAGSHGFREAIKEITVTLHLPCSGPPRKRLEQLFEKHHSNRSSLPKVTFRRSKGKFEIDVASELMDGRDWKPSSHVSLPLFARGVEEVIGAVSLMKGRLKNSDAFDLTGFLSHCEAARERLPVSEASLQTLVAALDAAEKAKRDAMSAWEKLDIDWEDFHPRAREILNDPFFWDCADDFSPNGNDTGADLLDDYRGWVKKHKGGDSVRFLEDLAKRWGYPDLGSMDDHVRDEAAIALAFAEIKLRGMCDDRSRDLAREAICCQRARATDAADWSHREERLATLLMMESKLADHE